MSALTRPQLECRVGHNIERMKVGLSRTGSGTARSTVRSCPLVPVCSSHNRNWANRTKSDRDRLFTCGLTRSIRASHCPDGCLDLHALPEAVPRLVDAAEVNKRAERLAALVDPHHTRCRPATRSKRSISARIKAPGVTSRTPLRSSQDAGQFQNRRFTRLLGRGIWQAFA